MLPNTPPGRYDRVAVALHWLIAALLLGQIAFGFGLDGLAPRGTPARGAVINLHKSCGLLLALAVLVRLGWRLRHRPGTSPGTSPGTWPAGLPRWQQRAATLGHRALYAGMLLMPLSGYLASNFSRHGVRFFGLALAPWGADLPAVYRAFNGLHVATAWVFTALVAGHVLVALVHALRGHGVFTGSGPAQPAPPPSLKA